MHRARMRTFADNTLSPVERAYNHILDSILSGELAPGMRVPAEAVAAGLGISRMPVRDALRRLEADGAVTIFANRGASVAKYSDNEILQLAEMSAVLEGLAGRLALSNFGKSELEELQELKHRMERSTGNVARWMCCHEDFHNYITSVSRRPLLMQQTEHIRVMLWPYCYRHYSTTRGLDILSSEHQLIIDAFRMNKPELVDQSVREHVLRNIQALLLQRPRTPARTDVQLTGLPTCQEFTLAP